MTTQEQHTPGPWRLVARWPDQKRRRIVDANGDTVAVCDHTNARLIAAAPDLLAALELYVHEHEEWEAREGDGSTELDPAYIQAKAAIARARGDA